MAEEQIMVSVLCTAYNHEPYIRDCLDGFVNQKTDFKYEVIIHDDASTDKTADIIREYEAKYPDIIKPIYQTQNQYSQGVRIGKVFFHPRIKGKYMAWCEGDDYWTDPKKLQKQVDFLESHPDFSLCCHRFKRYYENTDTWGDDYVTEPFTKHPNEEGLVVTNIENFRTRFTWTLTLCYRKAVADEIVWHPYILGRRDFTFHYHLLKAGKGYCFADYMGVYRINSGGVWQRMSSFDKVRFRLNGYDDFYSYHKDDEDVLICYLEWLDRFYHDYAFSVFARHKITRNGVKSVFFAAKHYWKLKGPIYAVKKCCQCAIAFVAPKKCEKWK